MPQQLLVVAELGRAHGLRGEVVARVHGIESDELVEIPYVVMRRRSGSESEVRIVAARAHAGGVLLTIAGIEDRTAAESARGAELLVRREDLPDPGERAWYVADLVGCEVVEENGAALGALEEILHMPAHDVYVVRGARGEVLLPATEEVILGVDLVARRMTVHLLPGLAPEDDAVPESGERDA